MRRALAIVAFLVVTGCRDPLCSEKVLQVARDPGSDRYASTIVRNCGATTGFVTVVRLGRASAAQSDVAEVFVADWDHGAAAVAADGAVLKGVAWRHPGQLAISFPPGTRVFKTISAAKGATVSFQRGALASTRKS